MPVAAARLCRRPRCREVAVSGAYCRAHQTVRYRELAQTQGTAAQRGYDAAWARVRQAAMRRDQGLCVQCIKDGYVTVATEVDHIVPLAEGGARLAIENVQALCHGCHARKTTSERERVRRRAE